MAELEAEWILTGSIFDGIEPLSGGRLGVSFTDSVDTRWGADGLVLGPLINTVDLGTAGGTAANTNGFALSGTMNATVFLYAIRGTKWAKVTASTMALVSDGTETALSEAATGIIYTKSADGTQVISIGMNGTAYRNITAVGAGATDTHSAHNGSTLVRVFTNGGGTGSEPVIYGAVGQTVRMAVLSGAFDMDDVTWETIAIIGDSVTPTSLAMDGNNLIIGTNEGPVYLQEDSRKFKLVIPEIASSPHNCKGMTAYSFAGVIVPLTHGTRIMKNITQGRTIGPEVYETNTSTVAGRLTAFTATLRWGYGTIYNPVTDKTYLMAMRPSTEGVDDWHGKPWSFWTLATLADGIECAALEFIDTAEGALTNPTMVGGYDDDMFWVRLGRHERELSDTNYLYAASGTWYGTELRRFPRMQKRIREVLIETANCSSTQTVQVKWSIEGGTAADFGAPITSNGFHRIRPAILEKCPVGVRLQPQLTLTTGSSSASPKVIGNLLVKYELVDLNIKGQP